MNLFSNQNLILKSQSGLELMYPVGGDLDIASSGSTRLENEVS